jgi:hypothetical protein
MAKIKGMRSSISIFHFWRIFRRIIFYLILLISKIKKQNLCIFYIIKFKN